MEIMTHEIKFRRLIHTFYNQSQTKAEPLRCLALRTRGDVCVCSVLPNKYRHDALNGGGGGGVANDHFKHLYSVLHAR